MKIVLFVHPSFLNSKSMPRYANMLITGLQQRGHEIEIWTSKARFCKLPFKGTIKKWLGYIDQYVLFPLEVKFKLKHRAKNILFVFADQALGPWVPLVKNRTSVIHCHDFLALKSAMGTVPENPTSFTGEIYQKFIRRGFSKGKNFISISKKTEYDLKLLHQGKIETSIVCYNGLNRNFNQLEVNSSRTILGNMLKLDLINGYVVHVGGNQYYKNRKGVIEIYNAWRSINNKELPLLLIGSFPSDELLEVYNNSLFKKDIHFVTNLTDEFVNIAYSGAICLLFPSLDEGFGWPIAEAMASGCLVITTNIAPMTEVLGAANFFLIDKRPFDSLLIQKWASEAAHRLSDIVELTTEQRETYVQSGKENIKRFDTKLCLDNIESFYQFVLNKNNILS